MERGDSLYTVHVQRRHLRDDAGVSRRDRIHIQTIPVGVRDGPDEALPESFTTGPPIPDTLDPNSYTPAGDEAVIRNPDPDSVSLMRITDEHQAVAEGFRHHLKHVRDRVFLAEYYDDLMAAYPGDLTVPKLVWPEAALANASDQYNPPEADTDGSSAQTGLDIF